jgi:hypothetical protein
MSKSWREHAKPIIKQVLKDTAGQPEKVIRKALKEAYPFGLRQYHPYKIWLDEIKVQRGKRKFNERARDVVPKNQTSIF